MHLGMSQALTVGASSYETDNSIHNYFLVGTDSIGNVPSAVEHLDGR
jgi:hypothetical protein